MHAQMSDVCAVAGMHCPGIAERGAWGGVRLQGGVEGRWQRAVGSGLVAQGLIGAFYRRDGGYFRYIHSIDFCLCGVTVVGTSLMILSRECSNELTETGLGRVGGEVCTLYTRPSPRCEKRPSASRV